jgi:hypothetical protein
VRTTPCRPLSPYKGQPPVLVCPSRCPIPLCLALLCAAARRHQTTSSPPAILDSPAWGPTGGKRTLPGATRRRAASPPPIPVSSRAPERRPRVETTPPATRAPPSAWFRPPLHVPAAGEPSIEISFGSSLFSQTQSSP